MSDESQTEPGADQRLGGVVLCGGESRRMGQPKAWLAFEGETLLQRVLNRLGESADPIVVVASPDQKLPPLPSGTLVARDPIAHQGPLRGLQVGLSALRSKVSAAYVTSCDVPFLRSELVGYLQHQLGAHDLVVVKDSQFIHPLNAVYRTELEERISGLLDIGKRRPRDLIEAVRANLIGIESLREVDSELESFININTPEEYEAALVRASRGVDTRED